jgi:hypothetical protein
VSAGQGTAGDDHGERHRHRDDGREPKG